MGRGQTVPGVTEEPVERSADWMEQARGDLEHARFDVQGGFYEWARFSAQQAAGKAVKAIFQKLGREAWGHSVAGLQHLYTRGEAERLLGYAARIPGFCEDLLAAL